MIASGEKTEEYREIKPYWTMRLTGNPLPFASRIKPYDSVTFYLGYAKDRPSMTFKVYSITIGDGKREWGAEPNKRYYVIKLSKRIIKEADYAKTLVEHRG